ncbi:MAG: hypothetical protein RLO52_31950 [Sandaracinaceae bacterium]|nr:MAG: hypothetical protein EVA89_23350 [Sandaracinaceae bacterium]HBQ13419.1 hypothetical protein [Myxococcales bacterium]
MPRPRETTPDADRRLRRALFAAVAIVGALQVTNNSLPYLGLRDDSCQTMFSGLSWEDGGNNHLIAPQRMLSSLWIFYIDLEVDVTPEPRAGRLGDLVEWLRRDGIQHNDEAMRVAIRQLCDAGHAVAVARRPAAGGPVQRTDDACADPRFSAPHAWIPVRLYDSHYPYPWPPEDP